MKEDYSSESLSDDDEDITLFTKKFKKIMRKDKINQARRECKIKSESSKDAIIYYDYQKVQVL